MISLQKPAILIIILLCLLAVRTVHAQATYPGDLFIDPSEFTLVEGSRILSELPLTDRTDYYTVRPNIIIDTTLTYDAVIVTEHGEMRIRLFDDEALTAVNNFIFLSLEGFYDGNIFHRVVENRLAQAGDTEDSGGATSTGYYFSTEPNEFEWDRPGLLGWANFGPTFNSGQFFVTFVETGYDTNQFGVFGQVISGLEHLETLTVRPPASDIPADIIERIDIYASDAVGQRLAITIASQTSAEPIGSIKWILFACLGGLIATRRFVFGQ